MTNKKKFLISILLCIIFLTISLSYNTVPSKASSSISFVIMSQYKANVDIGNEFYIIALTSNGKLPTWKSSNSRVASVNTYGKVTAKKAGTATITAKIRNAEASCKVTVNKTTISISKSSASIERGEILSLTATTSNNSEVIWKSSKKSIATIDENGNATGLKPGETIITATADGSSRTCKIKVKYPIVRVNKSKITLYRGQTAKLTATISSGVSPTWKSNRKSIAIIDKLGRITAMKHGTATITATVDGITDCCEIVVEKPVITLSSTELTFNAGNTATLTASVSSGNQVQWSSSNTNIATVDSYGKITGLQKGRAYIYAREDGTKTRCTVYITE